MNSVIRIPTHPQPSEPAGSCAGYHAKTTISPVRVKPYWRYQSPNYRAKPAPLNPRPLPMLLALQGAGIHPAEGSWILYELAKEQDAPYHAALLMNGKAYVVSQQDRVFYGPPGKLAPLKIVDAWRTKCPNEQVRFLKTNTGLVLRIESQNGLKFTTASRQLKGPFHLPLFTKTEARLPSFSGLSIQA